MKLTFSKEDELFRDEIAQWLGLHLSGEFQVLKYRGGPGDEHSFPLERKRWEQHLAQAGWLCVGWPAEFGGRGLSISQQVIFHEEYARAGGPGLMGHIGIGLLGPTLMACGTAEQQRRFLPGILTGTEYWCQGYSEPGAGSDLANVATRAYLEPQAQRWHVTGQKVWTSLAHESDWCFALVRTEPLSKGHHGLSMLLIPLDQPGVDIRPITQLTGTSEFNEVFFDDARTDAGNIIGKPGDGWQIAMTLLGFERGVSTLGQQMQFRNELNEIMALAKRNGAASEPDIRSRLADAWCGLTIMRHHALRMLSNTRNGSLPPEAMVYKLHWSTWHAKLGKLAMDVMGPDGLQISEAPYELNRLQALFLFSRADTIYGGSNEIQRNIIAERALTMPKEPRVSQPTKLKG
ncbi:acyl-CoA dehydrogenase family protein [Shewanella sp. GXUN23E]|uniref:acyl-CoA dehydrogenase family protein n=1 Tax=Shewanella sp. GXUN23E TaxID=3422498 RepID=UPI003D7C4145